MGFVRNYLWDWIPLPPPPKKKKRRSSLINSSPAAYHGICDVWPPAVRARVMPVGTTPDA